MTIIKNMIFFQTLFQVCQILLINGANIDDLQGFPNFTIKTNITSYDSSVNFTSLIGFGVYEDSLITKYFVLDWAKHRIITFNEKWKYVKYNEFRNPAQMITIGNELFITGQVNIFKTDKDLNIIQQYNATNVHNYLPSFRGIYYNSKNSTIYVVAYEAMMIYEFTLDFEIVDSFATSKHYPWSIHEYDNQLFVGTYSGTILVIVNKSVIRTFNACDGCYNSMVTSMIFNKKGFIYVTSSSLNAILLYNSNGSYIGTRMRTPSFPYFTGYDAKGRLVIISVFQITIYN